MTRGGDGAGTVGPTASDADRSRPFNPPSEWRPGAVEWAAPAKVLWGPGSIAAMGESVRQLGSRALLVSYPPGRTARAGAINQVVDSLMSAGVAVVTFEMKADIDVDAVDSAADACMRAGCNVVVGVGGGSAIDGAKITAMLVTNGGRTSDYHRGRLPSIAPLPIVAVATTVGTGAEVTRVGVVRNDRLGVVKSIRSQGMVPKIAVLDPSMLKSLPHDLLISGGFDALSHAVEAYMSRAATPLTDSVALQAGGLVSRGLLQSISGPTEQALENLMLGSFLAGLALNAGPGLAHVLAQPISAITRLRHADVISAILTTTVSFNEGFVPERGVQLAAVINPESPRVSGAVQHLRAAVGWTKSLLDLGASQSDLPGIMQAVEGSTTHIWTNPVELSMERVAHVLRRAIAGEVFDRT